MASISTGGGGGGKKSVDHSIPLVPFIDRATQPRVFGTGARAVAP